MTPVEDDPFQKSKGKITLKTQLMVQLNSWNRKKVWVMLVNQARVRFVKRSDVCQYTGTAKLIEATGLKVSDSHQEFTFKK